MAKQERLLQSFMELVKCDSESRQEGNVVQLLSKKLEKLGFSVKILPPQEETGSESGNLYAFLPGDESMEPLIFSAHMDTVYPGKGICPYLKDGYIQSGPETILGSDDKAGICAILEAVESIQEQNLPHRPIEILFSVCEELGLLGAKTMDFSLLRSKRAVVVDTGGKPGQIIVNAPGQFKVKAKIHGVASHAGSTPEKGVSAIMIGAQAIHNMKLLRIDEETTANVGTFRAVGATNIVSAQAYIEAEARSRNAEKLKAQVDHMVACLQEAAKTMGGSVECIVEENYRSFSLSQDNPVILLVEEKCRACGVTPERISSGGGSDANVFNLHGIDAVNISAGYKMAHTTNEQLNVEDFVACTQIVQKLMEK